MSAGAAIPARTRWAGGRPKTRAGLDPACGRVDTASADAPTYDLRNADALAASFRSIHA